MRGELHLITNGRFPPKADTSEIAVLQGSSRAQPPEMNSNLSCRFSVTFEVDEGHRMPLAPSLQQPRHTINFVTFSIVHGHREHS